MPFDGSGNFNRVMNWVNDAAAAIKIRADRHDQEDDNLAAGLSNTLTKDGQSSPTANIPLNGKRLVNVANPVNPQDAATKNSSEAIRTFNSGMSLTGTSTGVSPNFVSKAFLGFIEADMALVARLADPLAVPPTKTRLAINDKADGTGTDVFSFADDGVGIVEKFITTTQTWTKPAGLKYLEVIGQGAGGGGAHAAPTSAGQFSVGGGGGAGGHGIKLFAAVDLPASVVITIGAIGAGGASGSTSSFGALATVNGGSVGGQSGLVTGTASGSGAAGGGGGSSGWTINGVGAPGFISVANLTSGNQSLIGGGGSSSPYGSGGVGAFALGRSGGFNASGYGAGGSGANNNPSQGTSSLGGSGSPGFLRLKEYY